MNEAENQDPDVDRLGLPEVPHPTTSPAAGGLMHPDLNAARWLAIDTDRMTGVVPHLAEQGGLGVDNPVVSVNGQVVTCPFFDPGDGIWGGVNVGDVVAFFAPGAITYIPAIVVELKDDATARVFVPGSEGIRLAPHQTMRRPGGACWAHRTEEWTNVGRIAAELKLGLGGAAYEDARRAAADAIVDETIGEGVG